MKDELLFKIHQVMSRPITEEMQVVYLLVEIRKLMDRANYKDPPLRTFCDWVAHVDLHLERPGSTLILRECDDIVARAEEGRELPKQLELVSSRGFRTSLAKLCEQFGFVTQLTTDKESWSLFTKLYSSVVSECPIVYTASKENLKYVKKIELQRLVQGSAMAWRVTLKDDRVTHWIILLD